jgi:hypothetical protein
MLCGKGLVGILIFASTIMKDELETEEDSSSILRVLVKNDWIMRSY